MLFLLNSQSQLQLNILPLQLIHLLQQFVVSALLFIDFSLTIIIKLIIERKQLTLQLHQVRRVCYFLIFFIRNATLLSLHLTKSLILNTTAIRCSLLTFLLEQLHFLQPHSIEAIIPASRLNGLSIQINMRSVERINGPSNLHTDLHQRKTRIHLVNITHQQPFLQFVLTLARIDHKIRNQMQNIRLQFTLRMLLSHKLFQIHSIRAQQLLHPSNETPLENTQLPSTF